MKILVAGASGATGRELVQHLLYAGASVKVIVRSTANIPELWKGNDQVTIIEANISDLTTEQLAEDLQDCNAVASCLGHNTSLKGIYGKPRKLVLDAVRLLCEAIKKNQGEKPVKFVLMNTSGNQNRDLNEPISTVQKIVVGMVRFLVPPHADNEQAANYLRTKVGQEDAFIEWTVVRPDGLIDVEEISEYEIYPSPIRSAIFNAGKVSRINVGHFMSELITKNDLWTKWKGQMPLIYNKSVGESAGRTK